MGPQACNETPWTLRGAACGGLFRGNCLAPPKPSDLMQRQGTPRNSSFLWGRCHYRLRSPIGLSAAMTSPAEKMDSGLRGVCVCQEEAWKGRVSTPGDLQAEGSAVWTHRGPWEVGVLERIPGPGQLWEPSVVAWGRGGGRWERGFQTFRERKFYPRLLSLGFISR